MDNILKPKKCTIFLAIGIRQTERKVF